MPGHTINFNNAEIIDKGSSRIRKMLESWHIAKMVEADNNLFPLLGQYNILLNTNFNTLCILTFFHTYFYFLIYVIRSLYLKISRSFLSLHFCPSKTEDWLLKAHTQCNFKQLYQRTLLPFLQ